MPIQLTCECGNTWSVSDRKRGKTLTCPLCTREVVAQEKPSPAQAAEAGTGAKKSRAKREDNPLGDVLSEEWARLGGAQGPTVLQIQPPPERAPAWAIYAMIAGGVVLLLIVAGFLGVMLLGTPDAPEKDPLNWTERDDEVPFVIPSEDEIRAMGRGHEGTGSGSSVGGEGTGATTGGSGSGAGTEGLGTEDGQAGRSTAEQQNDAEAGGDGTGGPAMVGDSGGGPADTTPTDGFNVEVAVISAAEASRLKGGGFGARGRSGRSESFKHGMSRLSEHSVSIGLEFLGRTQLQDGHWDCAKWGGRESFDLGVTGLATLAMLADGHTHKDTSSDYQKHVQRALQWIVSRQQDDGSFIRENFYEQGIAVMVLCEALGMTGDEALRMPAQKGLDFILANMGDRGGYTYGGPGEDMSVTGFQVMAMKSAMLAGLEVPPEKVEAVLGFIEYMTNDAGMVAYSGRHDYKPSMTAAAMFCRLFLAQGPEHKRVEQAADIIRDTGPDVHNSYYTYYATYGMFQRGERDWRWWNSQVRDAVIALQERGRGELQGSWNPEHCVWGESGGRIYTTAMYLLALEVYYRYLPVYR